MTISDLITSLVALIPLAVVALNRPARADAKALRQLEVAIKAAEALGKDNEHAKDAAARASDTLGRSFVPKRSFLLRPILAFAAGAVSTVALVLWLPGFIDSWTGNSVAWATGIAAAMGNVVSLSITFAQDKQFERKVTEKKLEKTAALLSKK